MVCKNEHIHNQNHSINPNADGPYRDVYKRQIPDPSSYSISFYSDAAHKNVVSSETNEAFINAGTIYFAVSGKGQYYGDISGYAVIAKKDISELNASCLLYTSFFGNGIANIKASAAGSGITFLTDVLAGFLIFIFLIQAFGGTDGQVTIF